jgi:hypothetical protein
MPPQIGLSACEKNIRRNAGGRWQPLITNRTYYAWTEHPRTIDVLGGYGSYETTI